MRIQNTSPQFHKPGLIDEVVQLFKRTETDYYRQYTSTDTTNAYYKKIANEGGLPAATPLPDGNPVSFVDFATPGNMDVYPFSRAIAFDIHDLAYQADPNGTMARTGRKLLQSVRFSMEYVMADFMNLATTAYTAGSTAPQTIDRKPLAASDHPLRSGVASNIIPNNPVLSYGALADAKALFRRQKDYEGENMSYDGPLKLLVPPELEELATQLTDTKNGQPGIMDHSVNNAGRRVSVVVCDYFTSATAWALVAASDQENPLVALVRKGAQLQTWKAEERYAQCMSARAVFTKYAKDWRYFLYSSGAGS